MPREIQICGTSVTPLWLEQSPVLTCTDFHQCRVQGEKDDAFPATVVIHHTPLSIFITRDTTAHLGSGLPSLPLPTTQSLPFVKDYSFLKGFFFYSYNLKIKNQLYKPFSCWVLLDYNFRWVTTARTHLKIIFTAKLSRHYNANTDLLSL